MFGSSRKLEQRVKSLEESLGRLERAFQQLDLEWVNAYGKFRKIASRISHDQDVIDSREANRSNGGAESESASPVSAAGRFTPHQVQVQQQILKRRGGVPQ